MSKVKALGIAFSAAMLALCALGMSSASANWFKAEQTPAKWNGARSGESHVLQLGPYANTKFSCENVAFQGEVGTPGLVSDFTVSPELSNCKHGGTVSWAMNGCKFRFRSTSGFTTAGSVDIVGCTSPMYYEVVGSGCRSEIGNQNGLGSVTYANTVVGGLSAMTITVELTGITYTRKGSEVLCNEGPPGTLSNGSYTGKWTVTGVTTPGGASAGVHLGANMFETPVFVTQQSPVTISGKSTESGMQMMIATLPGEMSLYCEKYTLSGASYISVQETLALTPSFKDCKFGMFGEKVADSQISAGGCNYVFHTNGEFDIAGGEACASNPITLTRSDCVIKIGPQNGLINKGFTYKNIGSALQMSGTSGKSVQYTAEGSGCTANHPTPTISSYATLTATNAGGESVPIWFE